MNFPSGGHENHPGRAATLMTFDFKSAFEMLVNKARCSVNKIIRMVIGGAMVSSVS